MHTTREDPQTSTPDFGPRRQTSTTQSTDFDRAAQTSTRCLADFCACSPLQWNILQGTATATAMLGKVVRKSGRRQFFDRPLAQCKGGLLSFIQLCPDWMQLHVDSKYLYASYEAPDSAGPLTVPPRHFFTRDTVPYFTIIKSNPLGHQFPWETTYSFDGDQSYTDEEMCDDIEEHFGAIGNKHIFACQEGDSVWSLYTEADFVALRSSHVAAAGGLPSLTCALLLGEEADIPLEQTVSEALDVKLIDPYASEHSREQSEQSESSELYEARKELKCGSKLEGTFVGYGKTLGEWDIYEYFEAEEASERVSLFSGTLVQLPGVDHEAVLVRILGGKKKGGAGGRMQACYICLLYDQQGSTRGKAIKSSSWLYATLPHVTTSYESVDSTLRKKIEDELASFTPATVSGATQQAAKLVPSKPPKADGKKRKAE